MGLGPLLLDILRDFVVASSSSGGSSTRQAASDVDKVAAFDLFHHFACKRHVKWSGAGEMRCEWEWATKPKKSEVVRGVRALN